MLIQQWIRSWNKVIDARYEQVPLKKWDGIAQGMAGVLFTLFALLCSALPFVVFSEATTGGRYFFSAITALIVIAINAYLIRYTYQGFKGYKLVRITTEEQLKHASEDQLRHYEKRKQWEERIGKFLDNPVVRYPMAVVVLYAGYWLVLERKEGDGWVFGLCSIIGAGYLAKELSVFLLVVGGMGVAGWLLFKGVAALPVSVAIILGALILASALDGRK